MRLVLVGGFTCGGIRQDESYETMFENTARIVQLDAVL